MRWRRSILGLALAVACAGCGVGNVGGTGATDTMQPTTSASDQTKTTTAEPAAPMTTQRPPPVTTTSPRPALGQPVIVLGADSVRQITPDGATTMLLHGTVATAVDDTQGGLLFQIDRGRNWQDADDWDTIVYWVPRGEHLPQALLVPTPGAGHELTLHDSYDTEDGFGIVYTRHEGTVPFDDMADVLRSYNKATTAATDLYRVRGWEWNIEQASAGGGVCVATELQMFGSGCVFVATDGETVDLPGAPTTPPACWDDEATDVTCPHSCALDAAGGRIAFIESPHPAYPAEGVLMVRDAMTATNLARRELNDASGWHARNLDLSNMSLLYNRRLEQGSYLAAQIVDLWNPAGHVLTLSIAGRARFATTAVEIVAPVRP